MKTDSALIRTAWLDASASNLSALFSSQLACIGMLGLLAAPAMADDLDEISTDPSEVSAPVEGTESRGDSLIGFDAAVPLSENELTEQRAMAGLEIENLTIIDTDQNGDVSGNTATGNRTGNNSISDGAFVGTDGFVTTVQNTGNNVLIQNATTINVSLEQ